jgi:hypothetical protein
MRSALRRLTRWLRLHPSPDELRRFLLGDLSPGEASRVLQHLLPGCDRCQAVTAPLWSIGTPPGDDGIDYRLTVERVLATARHARADLVAGRIEAERLAEELMGLPIEEKCCLARDDPRYRSWALCELLVERSRESAAVPSTAVALAELAVAVAMALDGYCPTVIEDLRAAAGGALASGRCLATDLPGAGEALAAAREHLARGTGGRLGKARLLEVAALLREAEGRAREAARLRCRAQTLILREERDCRDHGVPDATEEATVTRHSPATMRTNPTPSIQPNLSCRNAEASVAATSGCKVL